MPIYKSKKEQFPYEYMKDLNATDAAKRCGYAHKSAHVTGSRLLKEPEIIEKVNELKKQRNQKLIIEADDVLRKILALADSDVREAFNPDGTLKAMDQWPDALAKCVSSVEVDEIYEGRGEDRKFVGYTKKIKLWDKVKSLEMLAKHKALLREVVQVKAPMEQLTDEELEAEIARAQREIDERTKK